MFKEMAGAHKEKSSSGFNNEAQTGEQKGNGQKADQIMACKCKFDLALIIRATNLAALK